MPPGEGAKLVASDGYHHYSPAYIGPRGWVGYRLDLGETSWDEVESRVTDSYRLAAPKRLVALLDDRGDDASGPLRSSSGQMAVSQIVRIADAGTARRPPAPSPARRAWPSGRPRSGCPRPTARQDRALGVAGQDDGVDALGARRGADVLGELGRLAEQGVAAGEVGGVEGEEDDVVPLGRPARPRGLDRPPVRPPASMSSTRPRPNPLYACAPPIGRIEPSGGS